MTTAIMAFNRLNSSAGIDEQCAFASEEKFMKAQVLAIAVVIATLSGISHADSACAAGSFANLVGQSCTIGDKLFTITSTTATLNGVSQDGANSQQESAAYQQNTNRSTAAYDLYASYFSVPAHSSLPDSAALTFDGYFELVNYSYYGGSTGFDSATFVLNESNSTTTVPEGSELTMLGITAAGTLGALKRKSLASLAS
jgi:hypothetical protein